MNNLDIEIPLLSLKQLKENWGWYLTLGLGLIISGTLAVMFAFYSTLVSVLFIGGFLIFMGILEGIQSFKLSLWSNFFLHLFLSILYIIGGIFILIYPVVNAISLTFLLALFFIVAGILKMIISFTKKTPHPGWLFFNGITTLLLGILIVYQWPVSGLWVIGMFLGIDAIFTGWTWVMLSLKAKNLKNVD
jgi:uncharacterized membrane protein HdeD (DUF308 family)